MLTIVIVVVGLAAALFFVVLSLSGLVDINSLDTPAPSSKDSRLP